MGGARRRGSGEWSSASGQRRRSERESTDERILGSGDFVERVLKEADDRTVRQAALRKTKRHAERVVAEGCNRAGQVVLQLKSPCMYHVPGRN